MKAPIDTSKIKVVPDQDTKEWWDGVKAHKLLVNQCKDCGYKWYPPFPGCWNCGSMNRGWTQTGAKGVIHSYVVVVQPIHAAFANTVPYVVALVELPDCQNPDGTVVRIAGVLQDGEEKAAIGLPVEIVWQDAPDGSYVMPLWRISGTAKDTWKYPA